MAEPIVYEINPTEISYDIDNAMGYGEMPNEALIAKFDETPDLHDSENMYDNYARDTLKDRSNDPAILAQEAPRKDPGSKQFLNLRYKGGRGDFNAPAHPEAFLGLTDKDPRGINVDPDFRKLTEQGQARMRYIRFHADADNSVHQGNWSESERYYKTRILTQKAMQPRMRIFSTSKDGRREGLRRDTYPHKSFVNKVQEDTTRFRPQGHTFTDYITDYALNPQRGSVKLSNTLTDRKLYNLFTTDHEFEVAKYGQDGRRRKLTTSMKSRIGDSQTEDNVPDTCEDNSMAYKAAGLLMGAIVAQKHKGQSDQEASTSMGTQARKTQELKKDLIKILHEAKTDADLKQSDYTQFGKTATPQRREHLARLQKMNHMKPAHHLFNAEIMYKGVQPGADLTKIKHLVATDDNAAKYEDVVHFGKRSDKEYIGGMNKNIDIEVDGQSMTPHTYKRNNKRVRGAEFNDRESAKYAAGNEDYSVSRKYNSTNYRVTGKDDYDPDTGRQFSDNEYKERHIGPMGKDKFGSWRNTQMSHNESTIADLN